MTDVRTRPRTDRTLPQMVQDQTSENQTRSLWFNFMRNVARSRLIWGTALIAVVTTAVAVTFLVTQFGYNQVRLHCESIINLICYILYVTNLSF